MSELLQLSALELAERIRTRQISSLEATNFYLERIDRLDGELKAFTSLHRRRALASARNFDARVPNEAERPLFYGVPSGIKDLVPVFGSFTRLGSRAWRYFISPFDAPTAKRFKRGGFVLMGKLSTSEFGALPVTEPDIHPPTRNPWNTGHSSGGSSGGSASAVAAGLLPIAQGSDGGGSIRIPGAFCHLYGFKPSLGLTGNLIGAANLINLSVMGPLARTVEDSAAMLDVLAGRPLSAQSQSQESCLRAARQPPRPLKIGFGSASPLGGQVSPEVVKATEDMAQLLTRLGHTVSPITIEPATIESFLPLWQLQMAAVPSPSERALQPVTRWLREGGKHLTVADAKPIQAELETRMLRMFGDNDVLLTPTVPKAPPVVGRATSSSDPRAVFFELAEYGSFTAVFNATDRPAASIPVGLDANGLPLAVQIGAQRGQDHMLLALSKQIEDAQPWRQRTAFKP